MTPTQVLAKTNTKDCIVEAAVNLFSRQGYNGTSTREIARLAGVNEVTIYRIFIRKKELFWAAVDSQLSKVRVNQAFQMALSGDGECPELVIRLVFEFLVDVVVHQPELIRLLGYSGLELGPEAQLMTRKHLSPIFLLVASYLERCTERGTLRTADPLVTVLNFAATVVANHCLYESVTGLESRIGNMEEASAQYTKYWTQALSPLQVKTCVQPKQETSTAIGMRKESSKEVASSS
jgi:AcrR family transcriptional regulator